MPPPVPLPGALVVTEDEGALLPVGDGRHPIGGDAGGDEVILHRLGAALAQAEVVLGGAPLVGVALDEELAPVLPLSQPTLSLRAAFWSSRMLDLSKSKKTSFSGDGPGTAAAAAAGAGCTGVSAGAGVRVTGVSAVRLGSAGRLAGAGAVAARWADRRRARLQHLGPLRAAGEGEGPDQDRCRKEHLHVRPSRIGLLLLKTKLT